MSESTSVHSSVEQSKRTPARRMKGDRCCPDSQSPSWMARVRVISCRDLSSTLQTSLSRTTLNNPTADRHLTKSGQLNHRVCKLQHLLGLHNKGMRSQVCVAPEKNLAIHLLLMMSPWNSSTPQKSS
jgi:hypothetical protein